MKYTIIYLHKRLHAHTLSLSLSQREAKLFCFHYTTAEMYPIFFPFNKHNGTKAWNLLLPLRHTQSEWKRALSQKTHLLTWMWLVPLSHSSLDSHLFTLAPGSAMFPWRYKPRDSHMVWRRPGAPDPDSLLPDRSHLRAWSRNIRFAGLGVSWNTFLKVLNHIVPASL